MSSCNFVVFFVVARLMCRSLGWTARTRSHLPSTLCPFLHAAAVRNLNLMAGRKTVPDKGPVMLLYELFNDVKFDCVPSDGSQHSRFKMIATANGKTFEGTGPSKKLAKNAAAKAALAALCNISYSPMHTIPGMINGGGNSLLHAAGFGDKLCSELPQIIADGIGK